MHTILGIIMLAMVLPILGIFIHGTIDGEYLEGFLIGLVIDLLLALVIGGLLLIK